MGYEIDYAEGGETFIREEPDCGTCGDAGEVIVFEFTDGQHTENCPDCNPTEEQLAERVAEYERRVAAGEITDGEAPF